MSPEPLAFATRETRDAPSGHLDPRSVENVHYGSIAVVSVDGRLSHWAGDPAWSTFTRSTLKPFQALPFVRDGGLARFGWGTRELALACASHSGEAMHVDGVASMLASIDCDAGDLQCGCHVPGWYAALGRAAPAGEPWSPLQHNCSGKHATFLAACRLHGENVDTYLDPVAPLQRRVVSTVASLARMAPDEMPTGTDGCSAPNYAMPLAGLAGLYARLAQGADDPTEGDALGALFGAMTTHPELVSGTARSDRALMSLAPGDWVTKIGADGVQAIGVRSAGLGIGIKIAGGDRDALYCVVVEVLQQLGLLDPDALAALADEPWYRTGVQNARGMLTGRLFASFKLRSATSDTASRQPSSPAR